MPANRPTEKATSAILIRVTPTQFQAFKAAAGKNVSGWIRQAANEKLPIK
jgi:hypothetical protein